MSLEPGTRLDHYEILAAIGSGAMGDVYKARDVRLDRLVAVKVITATRDLDAQARSRFDREARSLAALSHPHICDVYHYGEHAGVPFLVMEYWPGQTIAQWLREHGRLQPREVLRFGAEIAGALHAAHSAGIVHRDLKPENVMLTEQGAKLLDLGVSKQLPSAHGHSSRSTTQLALTRLGTVTGTIPYMAPEQLEGHPADVRSDIFSFGAVLYEMSTGRRAFKGDSEARIIASIMSEEPPPASSVEPSVPAVLDTVIERCLKKRPDARYQSSAELLAALTDTGSSPEVAHPGVTTPALEAEPRKKRRRRRLVITFSIGISFGVVLLMVTVPRRAARHESVSDQAATAPASVPPAAVAALPATGRQLIIERPTGGTIVAAAGIVCGTAGSACTATLPEGAPVTLQVETDAGRQFVGFTGDCSTAGQTMMTGPRTCGAVFAARSGVATATAPAPAPSRPAVVPPSSQPGAAPAAGPVAAVDPPPAPASTPAPPVAEKPSPSVAPAIPAEKPAMPVATEEEWGKQAIVALVTQYCAALATLQPARVQSVFPLADRAALQAQFNQYRALKCTVTSPPEYERFVVSEAGAGAARLRFGMRHVRVMKIGGTQETTEQIVTMTVSRRDARSPWLVDRVNHELKPTR